MSFYISNKDNRVPMMVRMQNNTIGRALGLNKDPGAQKVQLACWYYIDEDKENVPAFVKAIYAYAKRVIRAKMKVAQSEPIGLAVGATHLYRKHDLANNHGLRYNVSAKNIHDMLKTQSAKGNERATQILADLDAWCKEALSR